MALKHYWIVETRSKKLIELVLREEGQDQSIEFARDASNEQRLLLVPDEIAPGNCKVEEVEGTLSLVDGAQDKIGPNWDSMRSMRNAKLTSCDWTQLMDSPLSEEAKSNWAIYRQALRDLPENTQDPDNVTWPEEP